MGLKTFIGGVHPYEGKELAKDAPIKEVLPKGELVFPLSQHIGAPATPIVAVGDSVKKGQKIAEAGGFVSSPIYSSVSGTVKKIEPRRVAVGDMVNSIVIESDDQFTECEYSPVDDVTSLSREKIIERIKEAGVVGMGGAGFPDTCKTVSERAGKNRVYHCKLRGMRAISDCRLPQNDRNSGRSGCRYEDHTAAV